MLRGVLNLVSSVLWNMKLRKRWRILNRHNLTKLELVPSSSDYFFSRVKVGIGTYGPIRAIYSNASDEFLQIGNYCSIGSGSTFMLGSEHNYKCISTYPFKVKVLGFFAEAETKGPIILDDDVWLGENVLVLSGVKIGKGAVVAAGSIVVKDVPPYAIVGGNPAKVIKYRFSPEIIEKLMLIDLTKLSEDIILKNIELIYSEVTDKSVDNIINILKL